MKRPDLYLEDFCPAPAPDAWEVENNLSPAARRGIRETRIAAYERTPALRQYIPAERACLVFDI